MSPSSRDHGTAYKTLTMAMCVCDVGYSYMIKRFLLSRHTRDKENLFCRYVKQALFKEWPSARRDNFTLLLCYETAFLPIQYTYASTHTHTHSHIHTVI